MPGALAAGLALRLREVTSNYYCAVLVVLHEPSYPLFPGDHFSRKRLTFSVPKRVLCCDDAAIVYLEHAVGCFDDDHIMGSDEQADLPLVSGFAQQGRDVAARD